MVENSRSNNLKVFCRRVLGGVLVASVAVFFYLLAKRDAFLTDPLQTVVLLAFPIVFGAVAGWGLYNGARRGPEAILLVASLCVPLYATELVLLASDAWGKWAVAREQRAVVDRLRGEGKQYDTRTFREYFIDSWKQGTRVYPRIYQLPQRVVRVADRSVFVTSNLSNKDIVECKHDGQFKVWRSDEFGFTNPSGLHQRPVDVVLVGDSYTAGECVPVSEDIGAQLRRVGVDTLNLGIGGSGPLWQLANLVEYGLPRAPKSVYWVLYEGNDLGDLEYELGFPELTRYLDSGSVGVASMKSSLDQEVESLQATEILALGERTTGQPIGSAIWADIRRTATLGRLRMRLGLHRDYRAQEMQLLTRLEDVVRRAKGLVDRSGGRFVVVYIPDWSRFVGRADHVDRDALLGMLERNGVPVLDMYPEILALDDPLSVYPNRLPGHFNEVGYAMVADRISADLRRHQPVGRAAGGGGLDLGVR